MSLPVPTYTARVERGAKTNRVKGERRRNARGPDKTERGASRAKQRHAVNPSEHVLTVVMVSLPVTDLIAMDELAASMRMNRSALIREAVKRMRSAP